jgi:hypothetical protein
VCGLRVDGYVGSTVDAPMVQVVWQAVAILWVVTDDVLPLVACVAGDGVAVILVEAAYAVYLAIVFLLEVVGVLARDMVLWVFWRAGDTTGEWLGFLTVGSGWAEEVCHAITSAIEVVGCGDWFR